jgi:hypothetical protein
MAAQRSTVRRTWNRQMPDKKNTMTLTAFRHAGGLLLLSLLLQSCATNQLRSFPAVQSYQHRGLQLPASDETTAPAIRVMTLNIAHGRGDSFHQLLPSCCRVPIPL